MSEAIGAPKIYKNRELEKMQNYEQYNFNVLM